MSAELSPEQIKTLRDAMPDVADHTEGWEWHVLYRTVAAMLDEARERVEAAIMDTRDDGKSDMVAAIRAALAVTS